MKRFLEILLLFIVVPAVSCEITDRRNEEVDAGIVNVPVSAGGATGEDLPDITFEEKAFDFGTIAQGDKVTHTFRFTNTGKSDLVIMTVEGSCGCTVMKGWPQHPVKPGGKGKIDVIFDSNGRRGKQHKTISVVANTYPSTTVLKLEGEIAAPDID